MDAAARRVRVRDLAAGEEYDLGYDRLILSPGAVPVRPGLPGIERALTLRNIEDTDALVAAVAGARTGVVIGSGFIGLEVAENLARRGLAVGIVEATDQVLAPIDPELAMAARERVKRIQLMQVKLMNR